MAQIQRHRFPDQAGRGVPHEHAATAWPRRPTSRRSTASSPACRSRRARRPSSAP
ncbi:MAG: hypothetical protein MZV64_13185 [Ignavibacteriales bacterium]|nr:hypothetical protein [Ignavibacteriales bacterium]